MASLRAILAYAGNLFAQVPFLSGPLAPVDVEPYTPLSGAPSCPLDGPLSCHNSTPVSGDSCCFVHPGGRVLLTQFWDCDVRANGAEEDWTIHGLWPDYCDGSYPAYCNHAPRFNNITALLTHHGQDELLAFMDRFWVAARGSSNANLWAHEYNKHGTCVNTLSTACYGDAYRQGVEVVDYFARAAGLFRTLDTYTALERAGIVPRQRTRYPLVDVRDALERFSGGRVVLRCTRGAGGYKSSSKQKQQRDDSSARRGSNSDEDVAAAGAEAEVDLGPDVLHEAWYVYFVKGSLQSGEFVPAQELGREGDAGNCAPWVRYLPKRPKDDEL